MPTLEIKPRGEAEPELNLLLSKSTLEEPLWKSLFQNLDDFFFPKKLPPLVLTSKPVPVKDIWGFYDYKKNGVLGSTVVHMLAIAAIIGITLLGRRVVQQIVKPHEAITLVSPDDIPPLAAFEDAFGWRRWRRRSRQVPGAQRQTAQAVDGADHASDDGGAQR